MKSTLGLTSNRVILTNHNLVKLKKNKHSSDLFRYDLRNLCDVFDIIFPASRNHNDLHFQNLQFKSGQKILTIGQEFNSVYVVHSGFLKTSSITAAGSEQVLNFPMKGDFIGVDGILSKSYKSEVTALSDCNLISLPFIKLLLAAREHIEIEELIYKILCSELIRQQEMISVIGSRTAESRLAFFLVQLSNKHHLLGYSATSFYLRMNREDIGSYLGMSMETVSRAFSAFDRKGLIDVQARNVTINNKNSLENLCNFPEKKKE
jgi:CRP/FNR family transcriptional regulator